MPFCTNCGNEFQGSADFCSTCGAALPGALGGDGGIEANVGTGMSTQLPYYISLKRVLLMTALSYGLYLFYWFYITWKQFRDHTQAEAYPVWHTLTLFVPIYGLFRTHAHARCFRDLMRNADISGSISPVWAVLMVLVSGVLGGISLRIGGGFTEFATLTQGMAILVAFLDIIGIALVSGLLFHVQGNLNRYWDGLTNGGATSARIGVGEIIFGIIGLLAWLGTLANIFSESWRMGF